jgi:hypothetical protein
VRCNFWRRLGAGALVVLIMGLIYWTLKTGWIRYEAIVDSVFPAFLWAWWLGDISDKRQARIVARKVRRMTEAEQAQYFEDYPKDKLLVDRINGKYAFGMTIGAASIIAYMWGVEATTPRDSWFRLGLFGFLGVLVLFWLSIIWWPTVQTLQETAVKEWERELRQWRKIRRRYKKVKSLEDFGVLVGPHLRHKPGDDNPLVSLDRERPLARVASKNLTHKELILYIASCKDENIKEKWQSKLHEIEEYFNDLGDKVLASNAAKAVKE